MDPTFPQELNQTRTNTHNERNGNAKSERNQEPEGIEPNQNSYNVRSLPSLELRLHFDRPTILLTQGNLR